MYRCCENDGYYDNDDYRYDDEDYMDEPQCYEDGVDDLCMCNEDEEEVALTYCKVMNAIESLERIVDICSGETKEAVETAIETLTKDIRSLSDSGLVPYIEVDEDNLY